MRPRLARSDARAVLAAAVFALAAALGVSPVGRGLERLLYDEMSLRLAPRPPVGDIVIVGVDEPSFAELGLRWPWPRSVHGRLTEALTGAGARVIAFDHLFADPSPDPAEDAAFAAALAAAPAVVLGADRTRVTYAQVQLEQTVRPLPMLLAAGAVRDGFVGVPIDRDSIVRRLPQGKETFSSTVASAAGGPPRRFPAMARIAFAGPPGSFPYASYWQALDPDETLPEGFFADKIVLVGFVTSAAIDPEPGMGSADRFPTPHVRLGHPPMTGVEIHANAIADLLAGIALRPAPLALSIALGAGALAVLILGLETFSLRRSLALGGAMLAGLLALSAIGLSLGALWISPTFAALVVVFGVAGTNAEAYVRERTQRLTVRRLFGRYVADSVIDKIAKAGGELPLTPERRTVTILFADIAGFSGLTHALGPERLADVLRRYFDRLGGVVLAHEGTIERVLGDSLVAFFNAPLEQPDHAARAVDCALALDRAAEALRQELAREDVTLGETRIGINTGEVAVGNFGSTARVHYTALGDAINVAARLESAAKIFRCHIVVGERTAALAEGRAFRTIAALSVLGQAEPMRVFEPVEAGAFPAERLAAYEAAIAALAARRPDARAHFVRLAETDPLDPLVRFHLARIDDGELGLAVTQTAK